MTEMAKMTITTVADKSNDDIGAAAPSKGMWPLANVPGKFYEAGHCKRGDDCDFAHLSSAAAPNLLSKPCANGVPT